MQITYEGVLQSLFGPAGLLNRDRRSRLLLVSILLFYILPALSEDRAIGRFIILVTFYVALVAAAMELAEKRVLFWSAIPIAAASMVLLGMALFHPTPALLLANGIALALFLFLVSISLFIYLGEPGNSSTASLYLSVSLYFLLGMCWFALYNILNIVQPGSFKENGTPLPLSAPWSTMLYFSLTTLTTLGYGDILAVRPAARMLATFEAAVGVLYVAITISRLVSARQHPPA
ncbi:MAG TPA: ion channel [Terracidiphilus sp.]|jgi:hypothetical protein